VDSTVLADAVATQGTVTQLISAIRRVAREVPGAAGQIAAVCTGHDYSRAGKPKIDWDDPAAKDALVSALVTDANALVAAFAGAELEEQAASAVALLALVAGQDDNPGLGGAPWTAGSGDRGGSGREPLAWYGDTAYGTGGPAGRDRHGTTCPAGLTRPITPRRNVTFGAACRGCPLRQRCTTSKNGRILVLQPTTGCCAPPAPPGPPTPGCARTTPGTGPTSNAASPRSPPGGDAASSSATAGRPATTPGSNAAPPRSTCAT
jgi:hypothetical protein